MVKSELVTPAAGGLFLQLEGCWGDPQPCHELKCPQTLSGVVRLTVWGNVGFKLKTYST